jgi:hypothetical protein
MSRGASGSTQIDGHWIQGAPGTSFSPLFATRSNFLCMLLWHDHCITTAMGYLCSRVLVFFHEWVRKSELKVSEVGPTRYDESDMQVLDISKNFEVVREREYIVLCCRCA